MLHELLARAHAMGLAQIWLEVRESNSRAQAVYQAFGFARQGLRRGYYPAAQGAREDALVMSLEIGQACVPSGVGP